MAKTSGKSQSLWMPHPWPALPPLPPVTEAEVCVVGAGITGLSTAFLLAQAGRSVVVLDNGPVGGGQTLRTTAHLASAIDDRYTTLERLHGRMGARLAAESHAAAIDHIETIVQQEGIPCGFKRLDGYLFAPPGASPEALEQEFQAARNAGLTGVSWVPGAPFSAFQSGPCLCFPRQGRLHPGQYLAGLAQGLARKHGRLFGNAHVIAIKGGSAATVRTRAGACVRAQAVVVATNTPINDRFAIHAKQAPFLTFAIAAPVPPASAVDALFWDTLDPYHYARLHREPERDVTYLVVGGEDRRTGQGDDAGHRYDRLEAWARKRFPEMGAVHYRWSGQVLETFDGLAFIGRNPLDEPNVYLATGDSGMGMTHGTIAGLLLTDLILGRPNPWARLYDPSRKPLRAMRALARFAGDAVNMAWQYSEWLTPGDLDDPEQLAPGTGGILRRGLKKRAVYREATGQLHECSAVCPHLEGIVAWNPAEATWDCPCHGSRFDPFGKVIQGPAISDLGP